MRPWQEIISRGSKSLHSQIGYGARQSYGARPALLIIDVTRSFVGSTPQPIEEAVKEYSSSCGEIGWAALPHIQKLQEASRSRGVPVIFTTMDPVARQFALGPTKHARPKKDIDWRAEDIPEPIKPLPSELVIRRLKASAFFGTSLATCLKGIGIDSLLVTGATTSGCVRASVVDGISHGFPCFVVEECTFDRFEQSHLMSLFDMNAKYADVITLDEALEYLSTLK